MTEWSCEHCGFGTQDAPRECDYCHGAMCNRCTDEHDEKNRCPLNTPGRLPAKRIINEESKS